MPQNPQRPSEPTAAQLREALPELCDLLVAGTEYHWANDSYRSRVRAELDAMHSSATFGYDHHVELHRRQALALFMQDWAEQASR